MSAIYGNMVGGASMAQTYILRDSDGNEVPAVLAEERVNLDATANDIREGKVAATESGVTTGEKVIPAYHTTQGYAIIPAGEELKISSLKKLDTYDYTKLEAMVCDFNTSLNNSVSTSKVALDGNVYAVQSTDSLSIIVKNETDKTVELGLTNENSKPQIIRFFTYKEIN